MLPSMAKAPPKATNATDINTIPTAAGTNRGDTSPTAAPPKAIIVSAPPKAISIVAT